jgi:2-polyprenyl-6-methoxyphenol hydroxylase-like FAD-dependent oxidoreductase
VDPARLHLDHECTGLTQDEHGVTAHFAGGEPVHADVLIGADGLHSVVRRSLFGRAAPRYAGYTAWRAVVDFRRPALAGSESWGRGRRFGIIPMSDGRVYWYATNNTPEHGRDAADRIKHNLLELFRGWHEPVESLIEAAAGSAILRNDIYDCEPLPGWTVGRAALLGDAAHAMTPNLGQGACQAIEDALVLAACLGASGSIPGALRRYEERRIPRTTRILQLSRRVGEMAQWENPLSCFARDLLARAIPQWMADRQMRSVVQYEALSPEERALFPSATSHPAK